MFEFESLIEDIKQKSDVKFCSANKRSNATSSENEGGALRSGRPLPCANVNKTCNNHFYKLLK